jgi:regulator of sirC expression with transglutaminase-like and TPR domain
VRSEPILGEIERALKAPGDQIAPAALAIARIERPHLDERAYLRLLDEYGREAARRLKEGATSREQIAALNRYVFGTLGFAANREQYVDPRNNFLNVVIERRVGIPITLSIVYIEIGRRAGLPLQGIGFPGHFLVRCAADRGESGALVVDAFNGGAILSESDCTRLLQEHVGEDAVWDPTLLAPAERRTIALRILTNLKRAYVGLRSFSHARRAADLLLALDPAAITELRDRGLLSYHLEDFSSALRDLEKYLSLMPKGALESLEGPSDTAANAESEGDEEQQDEDDLREEGRTIWEHVKNLRRRVASFN